MTRSGIIRSLWIAVALLLVYLFGILARWQAGALIVVDNRSTQKLQKLTVKVEYGGRRYELGDLPPGKTARRFVEPYGESHVSLEFIDAQNQSHTAVVIGYIEQGEPYCGRGQATIFASGEIVTKDETTIGPCWRSWLDFVF